MALRDGSLESRNFATSSGTEWFVDVPADATMCSISVVNCTTSSSQQMRIEMASGGTETALSWRRYIVSDASGRVDDFTSSTAPALTNSASTTGHYANLTLYNLRTLAPVTGFGQMCMSNWQTRSMMFKSAASHNQIRISANGATINSGIVYVQFYERPNVVVSHDFSGGALAEWDIEGLVLATDSAVVLSSYDLTVSTATFVNARVSDDDVSYDEGASDYRRVFTNNTTDSASLGSTALMSQASQTGQGMCSLVLGLPVLTRTLISGNNFGISTSGEGVNTSTREIVRIDSGLRVRSGAGTMNGGTGYAVKYAM